MQSHRGVPQPGPRGALQGQPPFSHQSLEPETPNPTGELSHYITKLPFAIPYTKVKSFPFHFLKTEGGKKISPKEGSIHRIISSDSRKFCRKVQPLVCRYVISRDYLEDPVKLKNEMVKVLGTEIIAFMSDCFV